MYKHQWHVADAIAQLRKSGLPVVLDLVGPAYAPALERLNKTLDCIDRSAILFGIAEMFLILICLSAMSRQICVSSRRLAKTCPIFC